MDQETRRRGRSGVCLSISDDAADSVKSTSRGCRGHAEVHFRVTPDAGNSLQHVDSTESPLGVAVRTRPQNGSGLIFKPLDGWGAVGTRPPIGKGSVRSTCRLSATVSSFMPLLGSERVNLRNPLYLYTFRLFADDLSQRRNPVAMEMSHAFGRYRRPHRRV